MPWKECTCMSQRLEFVELAGAEGANVALLCRRFGVSRKTGYKWIRRFRSGGLPALADASRRPKNTPTMSSPQIQQAVVDLRRKHPAWGGRKIAAVLTRRNHPDVPAPSTMAGILRRHGLIDPLESQKREPFKRFVHPEPNDLWQMDFKGHVSLSSGGRCHPLTILDDHSRYSLTLAACVNEQTLTVQEHLIGAFRRYGLPKRILADNGPPWGTCGADIAEPWTQLGVWLLRLNIPVIHGRAFHPQTQGKEERFHRTLKAEVLRWNNFRDIDQAQKRFDAWREIYNGQRPHEALDMHVPAERYQLSPRNYPEVLPAIVYPHEDLVRRVYQPQGTISLHDRLYLIGKAFRNQTVALRATRTDGLWDVYYCQHRLGQIDERTDADRPPRQIRRMRPVLAPDSPIR